MMHEFKFAEFASYWADGLNNKVTEMTKLLFFDDFLA